MRKNVFKKICQLSIMFELVIFPFVPGYGCLNIHFHFSLRCETWSYKFVRKADF